MILYHYQLKRVKAIEINLVILVRIAEVGTCLVFERSKCKKYSVTLCLKTLAIIGHM